MSQPSQAVNYSVDVDKLSPEEIAEIANRLERDDYETVFESLRDWHILRTLAFTRPAAVESYIHLLDLEAFDEC
jgi:hypothetical protein